MPAMLALAGTSGEMVAVACSGNSNIFVVDATKGSTLFVIQTSLIPASISSDGKTLYVSVTGAINCPCLEAYSLYGSPGKVLWVTGGSTTGIADSLGPLTAGPFLAAPATTGATVNLVEFSPVNGSVLFNTSSFGPSLLVTCKELWSVMASCTALCQSDYFHPILWAIPNGPLASIETFSIGSFPFILDVISDNSTTVVVAFCVNGFDNSILVSGFNVSVMEQTSTMMWTQLLHLPCETQTVSMAMTTAGHVVVTSAGQEAYVIT